MILLLGCAAEPLWAVVSDLHGDEVLIADVANDRVKWQLDVDELLPEACTVIDDEGRFCLTYQSRHRVDAEGHDEVVFTVSPAGLPDEATVYDAENRGQIHAVRPGDPPERRWWVDRLDFSAADPDERVCRRDPADPCSPVPELEEDDARACQLYWPHDVRVLGEDEDSVALVVADTRNQRVLWLDAPLAGDGCATVTEVLSRANPDWDVYTSVNAVDYWEDGAGRQLLLSIKDTLGDDAQATDEGHGKIVRFEDAGAGWTQLWEFPPQSTAEPSFVNAPHGVSHDDRFVYFAHSLGRSDTFNEGSGGSVGVLDHDGGYRFDAVLPWRKLRFPRDVTPVGDGRLLLVDSGEKGSESSPAPTHLYVVTLGDTSASGLDGVWTPDGDRQAFRDLRVEAHPGLGDRWVLYSAEPVTGFGSELGP